MVGKDTLGTVATGSEVTGGMRMEVVVGKGHSQSTSPS